jgi:hypothetical protein
VGAESASVAVVASEWCVTNTATCLLAQTVLQNSTNPCLHKVAAAATAWHVGTHVCEQARTTFQLQYEQDKDRTLDAFVVRALQATAAFLVLPASACLGNTG